MARRRKPDLYDQQIAAAAVTTWDRYAAALQADPANVVDRSSVKEGDVVFVLDSEPREVAASYEATKCDDTWVLVYTDGIRSSAPRIYPMLLIPPVQ
jgi:hypothetical protein